MPSVLLTVIITSLILVIPVCYGPIVVAAAPVVHHPHPPVRDLKQTDAMPELGERLFLKIPTESPPASQLPLTPISKPKRKPSFVRPEGPFWNIDDIPILMGRFITTAFNRIPPHVLRRIQIFCHQYPAHIRCRKKEWKNLPRPLPSSSSTTVPKRSNAVVSSVYNLSSPDIHTPQGFPQSMAVSRSTSHREDAPDHFPPVPKTSQNDTLAGVPKSLVAETPHFPFQELKNEDRAALLKTCTENVKCLEQDEASTKRRERIADYEIALIKKIAVKSGNISAEDEVQLRLMRTQQVKNSLFEFAGIADQVVPADDGTFQNDILLTVQQSDYLINAINGYRKTRRKRQSLFLDALPNEEWDVSTPIKYVLDSSLETNEKEAVKAALNDIASQTCIKFELVANGNEPKAPHLFYVKVPESDLCGLSYIGRVETVNPIYLSFACDEAIGIVIHETLHALGVNHEQLRSDRDDYITIMWENINPKQYDYFAVVDGNQFTSYGVSYDYYSIMHYGPHVGAVDARKPSIVPKYQSERFLKVIGQRKTLSDKDIELLTAMYCSKDCKDNNVYCGVWALKRLCALSAHQTWMKENCKKSCGFC